LSNIQ